MSSQPKKYAEIVSQALDKVLSLIGDKDVLLISRQELHKIFKKHYFSKALETTLKQIENDLLELGSSK